MFSRKKFKGTEKILGCALFTILYLLLFTGYSSAQIKTEEVDIVKAYQPLLADAVKIQFTARPAQVDTSIQPLQYDVKAHLIEVPFTPAEIKPIALPEAEAKATQNNYIKAGFGTQLTPFVDVYLGNGRNEKVSYGLNLNHLSSNGKDFMDLSHTGGSLFATSYFKNTSLTGMLSYDRDVYHLYGFDTSNAEMIDSFSSEQLKQHFGDLEFSAGLKNTKETKADIDYDLRFGYHNFKNYFGANQDVIGNENYYLFNFEIGKTIQKIHSANLDFDFQREEYKSSVEDLSSDTNYFSILPNYRLHSKKATLKLGVNVDVVNSDVQLFPEVEGSYKLLGDYLIPYGGYHGGTTPNTLKSIAGTNPYLVVLYGINNEVFPAFKTASSEIQQVFIGAKGSYGSNITYNARVSYTVYDNLPIYLPIGTVPTTYASGYYYEAKILGLHAEVGFRQSERLNFLLSGEANSYDMDFDDQPWGIPKNKAAITANYNIQNKIFLTADVFAQSGAYTIIPGDTVSTQLKGFADLNFSATYNYHENLAFWLAFNNLAAMKERQWYNYPYYGFRFMAGAVLKF